MVSATLRGFANITGAATVDGRGNTVSALQYTPLYPLPEESRTWPAVISSAIASSSFQYSTSPTVSTQAPPLQLNPEAQSAVLLHVLGPSGCGRRSTGAISRLVPPSAGRLIMSGEREVSVPPRP